MKRFLLLLLLSIPAWGQFNNITLSPTNQTAYNYGFAQNNTHTGFKGYVIGITVASGACIASGAIRTTTVGAGGASYAINDTGTIGAGGATYKVTNVSSGAVTAFSVTAPFGSGYTVTNGVATTVTTGSGNGAFTVNITGIFSGTAGPNCATLVPNITVASTSCNNVACSNGDSFTLTGVGVFNGTFNVDYINVPSTFDVTFDTSQSTSASYTNTGTNDSIAFITNDNSGNTWSFFREGKTDALDAGVMMVRKSTNGGSTWTTPVVLFSDTTGFCNGGIANCDLRGAAGGTAPNGTLYLWWARYNWSPATWLGDYYSSCNPGSVDCTQTANWASPTQFTVVPSSGTGWCSPYTPGFAMPNGEIGLGLGALSGSNCSPVNQYIIISCDNATTWDTGTGCTGSPATILHVQDIADGYTILPTQETTFLWLGGNQIIGFDRNTIATYSPPGTISCTACGPFLFMYSADLGATWTITKTNFTSIQPQGSMSQWTQVSPVLYAGPGGSAQLFWGERDVLSGPINHGYIEVLTFRPKDAIASPTGFATTGQTVQLFSTTVTVDMGYPSVVPVVADPDDLLVQWDSQQYSGGPLNLFTNVSTFLQPQTGIKGLGWKGIGVQ